MGRHAAAGQRAGRGADLRPHGVAGRHYQVGRQGVEPPGDQLALIPAATGRIRLTGHNPSMLSRCQGFKHPVPLAA